MTDVARRIGAPVNSWLVQEFVADGVEVFAGVSRDPHFGLALAFGMGGVGIEVMKDFALRMLPLREGEAREMIAAVRGAALLGAYRNKPAARTWRASSPASSNSRRSPGRTAIKSTRSISIPSRFARRQGLRIVDALIVTRG